MASVLLALISAVAFATILAVVAGLTLTSASSVAHDLYANVIKKGKATEKQEVRVARGAAFVIGFIAILLAIPAQKLNIAFLVALAFAVAASANLPSLIYNLFWKPLQHPRRGVEHLRRAGLVASVWCSSRRSCPARSIRHRREPVTVRARHRLQLVPAGESGHHLDPDRLPDGLPRHDHRRDADAEDRFDELEVRP